MTKLKIKLLANQGAADAVFANGTMRIEKLISPENYKLVQENPDVLFFLTGGAESIAINLISTANFYVLIGSQHNNAYASATEVKTYLNSIKIPSILLDEDDPETPNLLKNLLIIKQALKNLKGKRLGLIGQVSDWLISSSIPSVLLEKKLGINLITIPWNELPHFSEFKTDDQFSDSFSGVEQSELNETAKVSKLLTDTIQKRKLDAITVECFPLVKNHSVTACLPLANFNNKGFPAGCEGDHTAIAGMMLCKELTGTIPWMANVNKVTDEFCLFSHCTIAPNLVSDYTLKTHFETDEGLAIQGNFKGDLITIFRFNSQLSMAFIATTKITGRPKSETACRTQIEVKLTENEVNLLKQNPLGNHHLIFPGDCEKILQLTCKVLEIDVLS